MPRSASPSPAPLTASPRTMPSSPATATRAGSRAKPRTRWPAAISRGARSAPIAPVTPVTRTFIRGCQRKASWSPKTYGRCGLFSHEGVRKGAFAGKNGGSREICGICGKRRCSPSPRSGWMPPFRERGCRRGGRCRRWRRFALPRRRCRARSATSDATSCVRSTSRSRARPSAPTIPTGCGRRASCASPSARSAGRRRRGRSRRRRSRPRSIAERPLSWAAPDLRGRVAVVTGASRGVGRGVALALGDCGATVYVTGRSTRAHARATAQTTVEDTADEVSARGGRGIPAVADHTDDAQTEALFARVAAEQGGRLDLLVANAWGGYEAGTEGFTDPFWRQPLERWDAMFTAGLRAQYACARAAAPAMIENATGLVAITGGTDLAGHYLGNVPYAVVKAASSRLVVALAHELRAHGVAAVGVYPGFTRTEAVVAAVAEQGGEPPPETHSPEYVGRAVAPVLAAPDRLRLSGTGAQAATLARRYGFADVDGRAIAPFALPDEDRLSAPSSDSSA